VPVAGADLERLVASALHWGATWTEIASAPPASQQTSATTESAGTPQEQLTRTAASALTYDPSKLR
jgi:hypothetical protein